MNESNWIKGLLPNSASSLILKQLQKQYLGTIYPGLTTMMTSPASSILNVTQWQQITKIAPILSSAMAFQASSAFRLFRSPHLATIYPSIMATLIPSSSFNLMQKQNLALITPALKAMMLGSASSIYKTMQNSTFESSSNIFDAIESNASSKISSVLELVQQSKCLENILLNPIFPEVRKINNLINKSDSLITTYNDLISIDLQSELDKSDEIDTVYKNINVKFEKSLKDKLSVDFFSIIFIPLVFQIYSSISADNDKKEIISSINSSEKRIVEHINQLKNESDKSLYYVIIRTINGYEYPDTKSHIRFTLYPNQKVRLIDKKGVWIHVEYFNNYENQHENSWILKKYAQFIW